MAQTAPVAAYSSRARHAGDGWSPDKLAAGTKEHMRSRSSLTRCVITDNYRYWRCARTKTYALEPRNPDSANLARSWTPNTIFPRPTIRQLVSWTRHHPVQRTLESGNPKEISSGSLGETREIVKKAHAGWCRVPSARRAGKCILSLQLIKLLATRVQPVKSPGEESSRSW